METRRAGGRAQGRVVCGVLCAVVVLAGVTAEPAHAARTAGTGRTGIVGSATVSADTAWDDLFQSYGDSSGAWNGGDGAQSLLLPNGNTEWFFADTYLGAVNSDGTRALFSTGLAHNSAVTYNGGTLGPTYAKAPGSGGYNGNTDYSWVMPPAAYPASRYELINGDQVTDGGTMFKFYQLADRNLASGGIGYRLIGNVLESFSIAAGSDALTPVQGRVVGTPQDTMTGNPTLWGAAVLVSGGYIYIYGVKPYNSSSDPSPLYVARVRAGGLASGSTWQYYDGTPGCSALSGGWTSNAAAASALMPGVSSGFSVTDVNGTFVLLTNDTTSSFTASNAVAYYAACPTGFSASSPEYSIYQPSNPYGYLTYEYHIVPQFSSGANVLVSYSTDTQRVDGSCLSENTYDATVYRPRFLDVSLPGIGGPAGSITDPPDKTPPVFSSPPVPPSQEVFHPQDSGDNYQASYCQPGAAPVSDPLLSLAGNASDALEVSWSMQPVAMWLYTLVYCDTSVANCGTSLQNLSSTDPACSPGAAPDSTCGYLLDWGNTGSSVLFLVPGDTYEIQVATAPSVSNPGSAWSNVVSATVSP